jgi:glycosyltransferase involved in cell wall biosynthesis
MARSPRVGVIVPAYNAAPYIAEALNSVLAQTYTNWEVIVVNDGSPDTEALEVALAPFLPRIIYIKQENQGTAAARNTAIRHTQAELIALLDADDVWLPDSLAIQVDYLNEHTEVDLVYGDAVIWGGPLSGKRFMDLFPTEGKVTFEGLVCRRCHVMVSVLAKREAFFGAGLFCESIRCEDFEFWGRFLQAGYRIGYHRKLILKYRSCGQGKSSEPIANLRAEMAVYEKFRSDYRLNEVSASVIERKLDEYRGELLLHDAKAALRNKNFHHAADKTKQANSILGRFRLSFVSAGLRVWPYAIYALDRLRSQSLGES